MDYQVPNTKFVLPKDSVLFVPALAIQRDPSIYADPMRFDPDRFTKDNVAARHPYAWMPFGKGPRECIGLRFAMIQMKLALVSILQNFQVQPSETTQKVLELAKDTQLLCPAGKMELKLVNL